MVQHTEFRYEPDYAVAPGETLQEALDVLGMSQVQLAERTGLTPKTINLIIKGAAPITPATALQLERVLGTPASFWNNREVQYRESLVRRAEATQLGTQGAWLKRIPFRAMAKLGWIRLHSEPTQQLREVLGFFGVASTEQWETVWASPSAAFRASPAFAKDPGAVAAWLRRGELQAQAIPTSAYDASKFRDALDQARALTNEPPEVFTKDLVGICAGAGVAIAFVHELPRLRTSGATRWLSPAKALIQLGLRYKTDDQLWFTFFHEGAHILLHGKRDVFLEDDGEKSDKEREANRFAADKLIPPRVYRVFAANKLHFSKASIQRFATDVGVAPGIIVGRLQHDGRLPVTHCNDLKRHFQWAWTCLERVDT
jgi:addiction module HigA family antidote